MSLNKLQTCLGFVVLFLSPAQSGLNFDSLIPGAYRDRIQRATFTMLKVFSVELKNIPRIPMLTKGSKVN